MKCFLIVNPGSRGGRSAKQLPRLLSGLEKRRLEYDYEVTGSLEHALELSRRANRQGWPAIVAVGGDGTINRVMNGFFDPAGRRVSRAKMGVIYTGTSPDFCRSYRIPLNIDSALDCLENGYTAAVRVGMLQCAGEFDGSLHHKSVGECDNQQVHFFGCCANIGLGPELALRANSGIRKFIGDLPGTFLALLAVLEGYRPADFIVIRDHKREELKSLLNLSIGRTFYIASGIKVRNELKPDDDRFYSLEIKEIKFRQVFKLLGRMYSGGKINNDMNFSLDYCKSIEVLGNNAKPQVEFDGDARGFLPCKIEAAPDRLELIVPGT